MDFKVAGTSEGITSLQMDIKIAGITEEIMRVALAQAKEGRAHILGEMAKALDHTREELSAHAPRIETMQIPKDKIRDVIGTGGKVIREIVATTGAKVDIDDEGVIKISSSDLSQIEAARQWISGIVEEPEVGKVYEGKVVNIVDFGAFVNFMGGRDGLVHVSEIKAERVENVRDVRSEGQEVKVKVLEIDPRGKVRLSMRVVDQETGAELEGQPSAREPRGRGEAGDRGDRGPRREWRWWRWRWRRRRAGATVAGPGPRAWRPWRSSAPRGAPSGVKPRAASQSSRPLPDPRRLIFRSTELERGSFRALFSTISGCCCRQPRLGCPPPHCYLPGSGAGHRPLSGAGSRPC
jgi:polyribonucleotide nucleotidyltransferase